MIIANYMFYELLAPSQRVNQSVSSVICQTENGLQVTRFHFIQLRELCCGGVLPHDLWCSNELLRNPWPQELQDPMLIHRPRQPWMAKGTPLRVPSSLPRLPNRKEHRLSEQGQTSLARHENLRISKLIQYVLSCVIFFNFCFSGSFKLCF